MRISKNMLAALICIPAVAVGLGLQACSSSSTAGLHVVTPTARATAPFHPEATSTPGFRPETLYSFTGKGNRQLAYTIGGDGDYVIRYVYSGAAGTLITNPQQVGYGTTTGGGFTLGEENYNPASYNSGTLPDLTAASGSGSVTMSADTGSHTLDVGTTGTWTIKVVSAP